MVDSDKETYWATDDAVTKNSFVIELPKPATVKYVVLQEFIRLGQRVKSFTVAVWKNNNWEKVAEGTTIGYKRILKIDPVETSKVMVQIGDSKASPVISAVSLY